VILVFKTLNLLNLSSSQLGNSNIEFSITDQLSVIVQKEVPADNKRNRRNFHTMINFKYIWLVFAVALSTTSCFGQNTFELIPKTSYQSSKHEYFDSAVQIPEERKYLYFGGYELNVELSNLFSFNSSFEFSMFTQLFNAKLLAWETKPSNFFVSKLSPTLILRPIKYIGIYAGPELNLYDVTNKSLPSYTLVNGIVGIRGYLGPLRLNIFKSLSRQESLETHSSEYQSVESYGVNIGCAIPLEKRK